MQNIDIRIESWKKKLLDLGKRNRLINFRETKRSNINILEPSISELYNLLVSEEKELSFAHPVEKGIDLDYNLFDMENDNNFDTDITIIDGDLVTNQTITEQQKTLKSLRNKAKTAIEEQGVNVLYLAFGFLNWKESVGSSQVFRSPIILVPVTLSIESLTSPYKIEMHDDEIVLNPTLKYKLENDFNIVFPEFDSETDDISNYLDKIKECLADYNWIVDEKVSLALFSFLKINMYMDLHRHHDTLKNNFAVKALCGDVSEISEITEELQDYDHDKNDRPIDIFQTVDADSSQQDAIVLSKKGISFVLQGPPGTGKSQTITNIISEALADGKKVLFVSEKMAALDVVYKRLAKVGLSDFCLTLHNHKANKKEILKNLGSTLNLDRIRIKEEAMYELDVLSKERDLLNRYAKELHTPHLPLNKMIYEANGILAKLKNAPNIIFKLENVGDISAQELRHYEYLLHNFSKTIGKLSEDYDVNVWKGSNVEIVTHELRQDIEIKSNAIIYVLAPFLQKINTAYDKLSLNQVVNFNKLGDIATLFLLCENAHKIPKEWIISEDIRLISETVVELSNKQAQYNTSLDFINNNYSEDINDVDARLIEIVVVQLFDKIILTLNEALYTSEKQIYDDREQIKSICQNGLGMIAGLVQKLQLTNQPLSLPICQTLNEVEMYIPFLKELNKSLGATEIWFDNQHIKKIDNLLSVLEEVVKDLILESKLFGIIKDNVVYDILFAYLGVIRPNTNGELVDLLSKNSTLLKKVINGSDEVLFDLEKSLNSANEILGVPVQYTLPFVRKILNLLPYLEKPIYPTDTWFDIGGAKKAEEYLEFLVKSHDRLKELKRVVLEEYDLEILNIEYTGILHRFKTKYTSLFKVLKSSYRNDVNQIKLLRNDGIKKIPDSDIINLLNQVTEIKKLETLLSADNLEGKKYLGQLFQGQDTPFEILYANLKTFFTIQGWVNDVFPPKLRNILLNNESILNYDITKENIEKMLLSDSIGTFKQVIAGEKIETLTFSELKNISLNFDKVIACADKISAYNLMLTQQETIAKEYFGALYNGEHTDFVQIHKNLNAFGIVMDYLHGEVPNELRELILSGNNVDKFRHAISFIENSIKSSDLINAYNIVRSETSKEITFSDICTSLGNIASAVTSLESEFKPFISRAKTPLSFEMIKESIAKLSLIQQFLEEFKCNEQELKDTFKFLFDGLSTNWEGIKSALEWTGNFITFAEFDNLQDNFIENVLSLQYKNIFHDIQSEIAILQKSMTDNFEWINSLYDTEYQMWELPLSNTLNKLNNCIMNLHGLEEWIDFKNARKECYTNGLGDVAEVILKEKIAPELIIDSFKKRFYKLWLDAISPNYPAVYQFRRKSHEDMIARFKEFDLKQMKIAELRVKEMLISKLPDTSKATSAVDEVGILKRELAKQRKIMPIRKLFARIPTLLPALKPCLMMSPLSVSLFLESELYNFDLVIFDEASQVCTENAIGAIMRSKQVIVAGDNKQLPPTNFFNATTTDSDYDVDTDDEIDDGDFESILDEMVTVFPERSLKWHYRSKNEQLITFSNIKIYNQSLITFPSSAENIADNGVEYIYVENGIYDRGGKKNNINEAKQVAKMVFEHFKKSGGRSISVITFSEAQQQAIDDEITKLRISKPMYEPFFNEEKDEAFFVKNLENVQGDERDTIIFSIGYAKDSKGVMYMNFGPLSRNGGYRRLNVAITRAKYNVKLVGSIRPTDIRLENTNSEGVKMLRSYVEFAINGQSALENELNYSRVVDVDSPFEEAVYDFLASKGYRVSTQVGCSGYRIDMAIHHPTLDGRFVIGIECDGAAYHSSRTARERDRLRQTVLEDMGWKFHRIWSTDWIKDPVTEGELLIEAVDRAIDTYEDNFDKITMTQEDTQDESTESYYETEETVIGTISTPQFNFDTYVEADACSARLGDYGIVGLCCAIKRTIEVEYPIHYELLCRRIAPIYGNQKATVKIRNEVNYGLQKIGNEIVRVGDFFYPKVYDKVIPKTPSMGELPRSVTHISDEEIGVAMRMVVADSYGITKVSLFQIVAKAFGFNRTGANITNAFERVFDGLVDNRKLSFVEGKVTAI